MRSCTCSAKSLVTLEALRRGIKLLRDAAGEIDVLLTKIYLVARISDEMRAKEGCTVDDTYGNQEL